jgi:hypothetical protein
MSVPVEGGDSPPCVASTCQHSVERRCHSQSSGACSSLSATPLARSVHR